MDQSQGEPDTGEEFESIPWDSLLNDDDRRNRRRFGLVGVAIAAVVVSAGVARAVWPQPVVQTPPPAPPTTSPSPVERLAVETTTSAPTRPITEADLMAVGTGSLDASAAGYAALWVAEAFTRTEPPHSFVDSVHALEMRDVGEGRVAVVVAFRTLEDAGDGYARLPMRAAEVVVDMTSDPPAVVDHPMPIEPPVADLERPATASGQAPARVVEAASRIAAAWGSPEIVETGMAEGLWRVEMTVLDAAGLAWTTAVWLDEAGTPVSPRG